MPHIDDPYEMFVKQNLSLDFWSQSTVDADIQINPTFAQRGDIFFTLRREA